MADLLLEINDNAPISLLMRQVKSGCSDKMRGACPGNCSYPGSLPSGVGSDPVVGASEGKSVSRNASEPSTAPLRSGSGQPANDGEASTGHEATSAGSDRAPRGVRGRRAETDNPGT